MPKSLFSLKVLGGKYRLGYNSLPDSKDELCICPKCHTHNILPINAKTTFIECMGCGNHFPNLEGVVDEE